MKFENLLPVFAPTPAGLVIAIRLYQEILAAVGFSNTVWQFIAGFAALVGCIGMIGGEMYAYKQAGIALAEGQIKAAVSAFIAAVLCSGLVIWAIGTSDNTRPLISAVVVAIAIYIVLAIRDFLGRKTNIVQTSKNDEEAQRKHEEKMAEIRLKETQAQARKARAEQGSPVRLVRTNKDEQKKLDPARLASVRAYIEGKKSKNEKYTIREVAQACGIPSSSTASDYIKAAQ